MNRQHVITMIGLLVLALATIGIGYGLWSEMMTVDATVHTGNVDVAFLAASTEDNEAEDKDTATCETAIHTPTEGEDGDQLEVTISEGYPGYACRVTFEVQSAGSVPVHIYRPDITVESPEALEVTIDESCYTDDTQLHQGESAPCTLIVEVQQEAEEEAAYSFSATIEARQYNEPREP